MVWELLKGATSAASVNQSTSRLILLCMKRGRLTVGVRVSVGRLCKACVRVARGIKSHAELRERGRRRGQTPANFNSMLLA